MNLEIGELAKGFETNIALVMHLAVLLLKRIGQRSVAARVAARRSLFGQRGRQGAARMR